LFFNSMTANIARSPKLPQLAVIDGVVISFCLLATFFVPAQAADLLDSPSSGTPVAKANSSSIAAIKTAPIIAPASKPSWAELNAQQQAALKPLAPNWEGMSAAQKRKWLSVSKDFEKLQPADQAKLHARMTDWSSLSTQQRGAARQNFAQHRELTDGLTPEQRKAQWQAYQQLSPEEKRKLVESAQRPNQTGAALAAKPQPVLRKEPPPQFGTAKVLAKSQNASTGTGKIAIAPHVQQQGAILPGQPLDSTRP
jgi:uncharacterized membrane protein